MSDSDSGSGSGSDERSGSDQSGESNNDESYVSNGSNDENIEESSAQLTKEQLAESRRMTLAAGSLDNAEEKFAERAELRERYGELTTKMNEFAKEERDNHETDGFEPEEMEQLLKEANERYEKVGAHGKELACDAEMLLSMSNLLLARCQRVYQATSSRTVNSTILARRVIEFAEELEQKENDDKVELRIYSADDPNMNELLDDSSDVDRPGVPRDPEEEEAIEASYDNEGGGLTMNQWAALGRHFGRYLRIPPQLSYLRPLVPENRPVPTAVKVKKVREKKEENKDAGVVLRGKQHTEEDENASIMKELDCLRTSLEAILVGGKTTIGYYNFVIDPTDFSRAIENMFYMSFLIKDGFVNLIEDDDGVPTIERTAEMVAEYATQTQTQTQGGDTQTQQPQPSQAANQTEKPTNQAIVGFNYELWEGFVDVLKLTEPAIKR